MDFYREIIINVLKDEDVKVSFPDLKLLDDETCFEKIEEIVCVFESLGSNGGSRHDFG